MKNRLLLIGALTMLGASIAHAAGCRGIDFPEEVQAGASKLVLNGVGLRQATIFKVNVYVAALYTAKKSTDPNVILDAAVPKELVLQFVRDVGAADISKGWNEGFEKNAKTKLPSLSDRIATLNSWMSDIKSGQRVTFVYQPGTGVQVDVNGTAKGTLKGDDFADAFFAIWLGAEPPNPEIKAGLLGGACG